MPVLRWGAATDPGLVRSENEDTFVAEPMVFAVADGMGGHQAGEVASALAASIMRDRLGGGAASEDAAAAAVGEANSAIFGAAKANSAQSGMGTTLTAIAVLNAPAGGGPGADHEERFVLLNVGDSRTYRFRAGRLQRVTVDHSYVQELVASGHISQDEARTHPRRNIVTRALGIEPMVRADMWTLPIVRGDRYVLASDGLVDEVADNEILELVAAVDDPQALAEQLVALANHHGGRDNVTVVIVDILEGADPPDPTDELEADPSWADAVPDADGLADSFAPPVPAAGSLGVFSTSVPADGAGDAHLEKGSAHPPPAPPSIDVVDVDSAEPVPTSASIAAAAARPLADEPSPVAASVAYLPESKPGAMRIDESATDIPEPHVAAQKPPQRRFSGGVFLFIVGIALILTITVTVVSLHARSGYFVGFDGDTVVVYKGQRDSILWFEPTVSLRTQTERDELTPQLVAAIEAKPTFDSSADAAQFVTDLVVPEETPETTTTSTTDAATTTTASSNPESSTTVVQGP